jgi:hypothetical protein
VVGVRVRSDPLERGGDPRRRLPHGPREPPVARSGGDAAG